MLRLAIIGESESVLAFKAVGFDTFEVTMEQAAHTLREKYHSGKYAVIFISENLARNLVEEMAEFTKKPIPAIGILPLGRQPESFGMEQMKKISIRATGTDIFSKIK